MDLPPGTIIEYTFCGSTGFGIILEPPYDDEEYYKIHPYWDSDVAKGDLVDWFHCLKANCKKTSKLAKVLFG